MVYHLPHLCPGPLPLHTGRHTSQRDTHLTQGHTPHPYTCFTQTHFTLTPISHTHLTLTPISHTPHPHTHFTHTSPISHTHRDTHLTLTVTPISHTPHTHFTSTHLQKPTRRRRKKCVLHLHPPSLMLLYFALCGGST